MTARVPKAALLLYDEGPDAGLGHRRRMEALAIQLNARGWKFRLAPAVDPGPYLVPLIVVDSYRVPASEWDALDVVAAVDDLGRDLDVDVVIDPSPGADPTVHRRARCVLAGSEYALVGLPQLTVPPKPASAPVDRVLVTTGAADGAGVGADIAATLHRLLPGVEVRLVVGPWASSRVPDGVVAVAAPNGLYDELAAAPVVVTAGGVSMLEAALLGRAIVAVRLADNQEHAVATLAAAEAVVAAPHTCAGTTAAALVADPERRRALGTAARRAVDGKGAARAATEIADLLAARAR